MPSWNYAEDRADADGMIAEAGQEGIIRRAGESTGDPWNPTVGEPTDHPCLIVDFDFSAMEIDGSLIRAWDRRVLVSAGSLDIEPTEVDTIVIGGQEHAIVRVSPLAPGGVVVLYEIQARA